MGFPSPSRSRQRHFRLPCSDGRGIEAPTGEDPALHLQGHLRKSPGKPMGHLDGEQKSSSKEKKDEPWNFSIIQVCDIYIYVWLYM